jgi:hypothetical protein
MEDWVVARRDGLLVAELDDELMGLHEEAGTCYGFNATASCVWKAIERPRTFSQLRAELMRQFEVDDVRCDKELRKILLEFEAKGLVALTR